MVHSTTKFINGHSDAFGGVVVTRHAALRDALRSGRDREGAIPGALEAWLTLRGVRTLPLRVLRQSATAGDLATWLSGRADVVEVWYPGLTTHPGHDVASGQMQGYGGVLSFELADFDRAASVVDGLRLFRKATSLGGVESLVEHRHTVNPQAPEGLLRLSVGLEPAEALIDDLAAALTA